MIDVILEHNLSIRQFPRHIQLLARTVQLTVSSVSDFMRQNHSEAAFIHFSLVLSDVKQMQQILCFLLALFL